VINPLDNHVPLYVESSLATLYDFKSAAAGSAHIRQHGLANAALEAPLLGPSVASNCASARVRGSSEWAMLAGRRAGTTDSQVKRGFSMPIEAAAASRAGLVTPGAPPPSFGEAVARHVFAIKAGSAAGTGGAGNTRLQRIHESWHAGEFGRDRYLAVLRKAHQQRAPGNGANGPQTAIRGTCRKDG
jgi:hypothetical protein